MTPEMMQAKLNGQTTIAQKVYGAVPIQDAWPINRILAGLNEVTRSVMDQHTARGCIHTLKEAGLIRELAGGLYRRVEVKERNVEVRKAPTAPAGQPAGTPDPLELLSGLSTRLRTVMGAIGQLADELDNAALVLDQSRADGAELEELRRMRAALRTALA